MRISWPRVALVAILIAGALGASWLGMSSELAAGFGILVASLVKSPLEPRGAAE